MNMSNAHMRYYGVRYGVSRDTRRECWRTLAGLDLIFLTKGNLAYKIHLLLIFVKSN